jgi:hemolysin activation/secretion protein
VQLIGFVDTGYVTQNYSPWYNGPNSPWFNGSNSASRSGVGVGLTWAEINNFSVSVGVAHRLGDPPTSAPDQWGRIWFQVIKYF